MNFKIEAAVEKPYTSHPGKSLYPWADIEVGQGIHVPDRVVRKEKENWSTDNVVWTDQTTIKRKPNDLKTSAKQWAKRNNKDVGWDAFRYEHPDNGWGVQINRVK